ncbi:hypothetical protein G7077_12075 [Sphingomonas piscis]|uniref:Uncharacterized protein n=1 Tax=Sphingomonas piscis TaxID=2714943 RepID=A0A6G7YS16_9SPHN|nr:hypothetical protein [Sphingomonas piscis]QIK79535.1 hypothetical protein G7077_12075 [Sphingomonas piscis]
MIILTMASAISLLGLQASVNAPRSAFATCIREASAKAKADNVTVDAYKDYVRAACDPAGSKLKNALVAFDTKNGVSKARASEDAEMEVDDTFDADIRTYKRLNGPSPQVQ